MPPAPKVDELHGTTANPQAVAKASEGTKTPPLTFSIVLKKEANQSLGIDVHYSSAAGPWARNGVFVVDLQETSVIAAWNRASQEPRCVRRGDFIFQVNEVHSDTVAMIQEMKVKEHLTIHIVRREADMAAAGLQTAAPRLTTPPPPPLPS